jgi:hypothetical protein
MTTKAKSVVALREGIADFGEKCENPMNRTVKHL